MDPPTGPRDSPPTYLALMQCGNNAPVVAAQPRHDEPRIYPSRHRRPGDGQQSSCMLEMVASTGFFFFVIGCLVVVHLGRVRQEGSSVGLVGFFLLSVGISLLLGKLDVLVQTPRSHIHVKPSRKSHAQVKVFFSRNRAGRGYIYLVSVTAPVCAVTGCRWRLVLEG